MLRFSLKREDFKPFWFDFKRFFSEIKSKNSRFVKTGVKCSQKIHFVNASLENAFQIVNASKTFREQNPLKFQFAFALISICQLNLHLIAS